MTKEAIGEENVVIVIPLDTRMTTTTSTRNSNFPSASSVAYFCVYLAGQMSKSPRSASSSLSGATMTRNMATEGNAVASAFPPSLSHLDASITGDDCCKVMCVQ